MDPLTIMIAAFVGVVALILAIGLLMREMGSKTAEDRLAVLTGRKTADQATGAITKDEIFSEGLAGLNGVLSKLMDRLNGLKRLFEQADSPLKPNAFFGLSAATAVVGVIVGIIAKSPAPLYPICALTGAMGPFVWLLMRRKRRFKKFAQQLPDALELVARALRSGHSLASGLHVVVDEMPSPTSEEFARAYEEQNLGVPLEQALKNMLHRMPNMDLKFFVTAVAIQRTAGGDMAELLDKIGYLIRERFKIMGQVQALTGEGRISGVVLMGLPIVLFFAVYYLNPDYVMLLFTEPLGRKMIAGAAVLQVAGAICIKKIVNIKI